MVQLTAPASFFVSAAIAFSVSGAASTSDSLTGAETVPVLAVLTVFLMGWLVFSLSYALIQHREARA